MNATWGSSTADSYCTTAEADAFFETQSLDSEDWFRLDEQEKSRALVHATRTIDAHTWHSSRYFEEQSLEFPRLQPSSDGLLAGTGQSPGNFSAYVSVSVYLRRQQQRVKQACAIQAQYLARNRGRNLEREEFTQGVVSSSSSRAGISESRSFRASGPDRLHPEAADLLREYRITPRVMRG